MLSRHRTSLCPMRLRKDLGGGWRNINYRTSIFREKWPSDKKLTVITFNIFLRHGTGGRGRGSLSRMN